MRYRNGTASMRFEDADRLLDPAPLAIEMGFERGADGVLHVACRTDMRGCTGAMLEWWFALRPDTRQYRWWHPIDHVASEWAEARDGTHVGSIHVATECFIGGPAAHLSIQFRDPAEFFSERVMTASRTAAHVSGLIVARAGESHAPQRTADGAMIGSRLLHVCRDTSWGMVLRSHYFLGQDLPDVGMPPEAVARALPDPMAPALLQHCYEEFTYLAEILPGLYRAEARDPSSLIRPW